VYSLVIHDPDRATIDVCGRNFIAFRALIACDVKSFSRLGADRHEYGEDSEDGRSARDRLLSVRPQFRIKRED
jgi:hypothetical protein